MRISSRIFSSIHVSKMKNFSAYILEQTLAEVTTRFLVLHVV